MVTSSWVRGFGFIYLSLKPTYYLDLFLLACSSGNVASPATSQHSDYEMRISIDASQLRSGSLFATCIKTQSQPYL